MRKTKTSYSKSRIRGHLLLAIAKYHIKCYFCEQEFTEADVPARGVDKLTEHHENENRADNRPENRFFAHRDCHKRHHMSKNRNRLGKGGSSES